MSKELIRKSKDGDARALNELINNHRDLAFSIAMKYLKNTEDAEDIVQNSFIIVLKSIKNFRNESKFSTWLFTIVYHECLRELKLKNYKTEYIPQFIEYEEETNITNDYKLEKLLETLKPNEYTVITLFYLKEKTIKDISEITSLSKANIKVLLHRGRYKMKQLVIKKST
jgi:RNA polymerase sigma-70 factor (ECF subfamily)